MKTFSLLLFRYFGIQSVLQMLTRRLLQQLPLPSRSMGLVQGRWFTSAGDKPAFTTSGERHIYEKLERELKPTKLAVTDSSGGCGSMYVVEVEAESFRGLTRVKQTQLVNGLLKDEIKDMHGMRVLCSVPPSK